MKRFIDVTASAVGLVLLSPLLLVVTVVIWLSDRESPFFVSVRCGREGKPFRIVKFRSMVTGAHLSGVSSTADTDTRITRVGALLRAYKLDELPQLVNVLKGDMSLVGPRPNVRRAIDMYSDEELGLLKVRPGITDLASIVFADEGAILADKADPDIAYEQLIRPGKSRLGLFYADRGTPLMDVRIVLLTVIHIFNRQRALDGVATVLDETDAPSDLIALAERQEPLQPSPPPGLKQVVTSLEPVSR